MGFRWPGYVNHGEVWQWNCVRCGGEVSILHFITEMEQALLWVNSVGTESVVCGSCGKEFVFSHDYSKGETRILSSDANKYQGEVNLSDDWRN